MLTLTRTQVWSRKLLANPNMHRLYNYLRKPLVDFILILTLTLFSAQAVFVWMPELSINILCKLCADDQKDRISLPR